MASVRSQWSVAPRQARGVCQDQILIHSGSPSVIRPSCHFLPKVINSSQAEEPESCQQNNKLFHVWHFLFLHPSVCSSWDAALRRLHHHRRESSTKNCKVKCRVRPSAALASECRLSGFIITLGDLVSAWLPLQPQNKHICQRINNKQTSKRLIHSRGPVRLKVSICRLHLSVSKVLWADTAH